MKAVRWCDGSSRKHSILYLTGGLKKREASRAFPVSYHLRVLVPEAEAAAQWNRIELIGVELKPQAKFKRSSRGTSVRSSIFTMLFAGKKPSGMSPTSRVRSTGG